MSIQRGSVRQSLVTDLLSSERYFTTGELLTALKGRGIDRVYVLWVLSQLRKSNSLDEMADETHKLRKKYRLKTISSDEV